MPHTVLKTAQLDSGQVSSIRALVAELVRDDGRDPLSDQALTRLTSPAVEHVLVIDGDRVTGYAQLDGDSLEVAAEPDAIAELLNVFGDRTALVWSHGSHSRLVPVLTARGFSRQRELHQLRRSLTDPIDVPVTPDGVEIRPFVVGTDEDAWLRTNAAAFATHAEQGGWTRADLEAREHEPWFDPSGFLLAWRGDALSGFHWTKVHPDGAGEVYVLAVDPSAQGSGLGAVLLQLGLAHLRDGGCAEVLLYVDGSNPGAIRLYERAGFHHHDLDVQWLSPR